MGDERRDTLRDGAQRLRGEVAADPSLVDDEARFRRAAAAAARDLEPDDPDARGRLEARLAGLRSQFAEAGS